jgi:uncharacterized membrane protein YesL
MALLLKSVQPASGKRWIGDALRLFARRPLPFTLMFCAFMFVALLVLLVPLLGPLLQMALVPLLSLGFMVASQSALLDGPVTLRQFIEPLRGDPARRRALLLLCLIYGLAALGILWLCDAISGQALARLEPLRQQGDAAMPEIIAVLSEPGVGNAVLVGALLAAALSVPFWHAPALVHWGGQSLGQALFSSTLAVWRARGAFLVYALVGAGLVLLFGILTALLLGLLGAPQLVAAVSMPAGLLFSTVFYVSLIFTFNDSFGGATAARAPEPPTAA